MISNFAASAPVRANVSVPSASSVTTMSATLMCAAVEVFSARAAVAFASAMAVGALLGGATPMVNTLSVKDPSALVARIVMSWLVAAAKIKSEPLATVTAPVEELI